MNELTRAQRRDIRTLATTMCANYDQDQDSCPLLDDYGCYMLTKACTDGKLCKYFREAVLPLNPTLEAALTGKAVDAKPCVICGKKFAASGRQVYCSEKCGQKGRKAATAKRNREYRNRQVKSRG